MNKMSINKIRTLKLNTILEKLEFIRVKLISTYCFSKQRKGITLLSQGKQASLKIVIKI